MIKKLGFAMFSLTLLTSSASYSFAHSADSKSALSAKPTKLADMPTECHITSNGMDCKIS